eukprot:Polyplicarium_translucidae@DN3163_c0_g1_i1.p2
MYGIFHGWDGETPLALQDVQLSLYNEMDDFSAEWIQRLDDDLQLIRNALSKRFPQLDLSRVMPLGDRVVAQYGDCVKDRSSLKTIFRTNAGYNGFTTPTMRLEGGYIPDVKSRVFLEDIPSGLCVLKGIAQFLGVTVPSIDHVILWSQKVMRKEYLKVDDSRGPILNPAFIHETTAPGAFGFATIEESLRSSLPSQEGR